MSQNNAEGFLSGFSVFQPAIGAPLQFIPALGSKELDDLLAIYFASEGTVRDQITTVSIDFFEYAALTGELFKFYPVFDPSLFHQTSSNSPSSSSYESSFNTSPGPVELSPWTPALSDFGTPISTTNSAANFPAFPASQSTAISSSSSSASSSTSRPRATDFSHLPGMRIMTRDGRDVTQSASRGCKTKEQRDHAHLMRIIKACDACKARKVRCDPSHKKRSPSSSSNCPLSVTDTRVKKRHITTRTRDPSFSATPSGLPSESGLPQASGLPSRPGLPQASGLPQRRLPRPGVGGSIRSTTAWPGLFVLLRRGILIVMALICAIISSTQALLLGAVSGSLSWPLAGDPLRWASEGLVCRARHLQEVVRCRKPLRDFGAEMAGFGRHTSWTLLAWC